MGVSETEIVDSITNAMLEARDRGLDAEKLLEIAHETYREEIEGPDWAMPEWQAHPCSPAPTTTEHQPIASWRPRLAMELDAADQATGRIWLEDIVGEMCEGIWRPGADEFDLGEDARNAIDGSATKVLDQFLKEFGMRRRHEQMLPLRGLFREHSSI